MGAAAPAIAVYATVASTAVAAYSAYSQYEAQKDQAKYQQAVANNNKIMAERMAEDARYRGDEAARRARMKAQQLAGQQRAMLADSGVQVDYGSAIDLIGDTITIGEADALTLKGNAEREALGYLQRAAGFEAQSGLYGLEANQAGIAQGIGVAGSLASGVGSVSDKWYKYYGSG